MGNGMSPMAHFGRDLSLKGRRPIDDVEKFSLRAQTMRAT
jgi:hypothetical protein